MNEPKRVRLVDDPMSIGVLTGRTMKRAGRTLVQVAFPQGLQWKDPDQLEDVTEERQDPLQLLLHGRLGLPDDLRRTLTHVRLTGRLADMIYSMEVTNTDFYAYQFKPVLKILQSPTNAILVADEVGLGKTIEAGLIWTELRSRFDFRRLLIVCPAALRRKWVIEMRERMGVEARIADAGEALDVLKNQRAYGQGFALVCSSQGLRPPRTWRDQANSSKAARLARFLDAQQHEDPLVDLLIVDEAHHLKNPETQTNRLGGLLRELAQYVVLLTATPIHTHSADLYSLLHLLDPDTFQRPEAFDLMLEANEPLVRARDLVLRNKATTVALRQLLEEAQQHSLLADSQQLRQLLNDTMTDTLQTDASLRSTVASRLESVNLLAHVVTRTRKRDVKEWRVIREPHAELVDLTPLEREIYDAVTRVVIEYAMQRDVNDRFLLATPQRQLASCMAATLTRWKNRYVELAEVDEEEDDENEDRKKKLGPLAAELVRRCGSKIDLVALRAHDSKFDRLRAMLDDFFEKHPNDKVIVFSTFRSTLDYLSERLEQAGYATIVLKGGQRRSKQEVIDDFKAAGGKTVLLSSEVGGEGVDLQFCWVVVNYDLPWNPMRVEQRIGRVDRLGQDSPKILVWNLFYADTIDARIYTRLYDRLDLCRRALGDFEEILGKEIQRLTSDLLSQELTPGQEVQRVKKSSPKFVFGRRARMLGELSRSRWGASLVLGLGPNRRSTDSARRSRAVVLRAPDASISFASDSDSGVAVQVLTCRSGSRFARLRVSLADHAGIDAHPVGAYRKARVTVAVHKAGKGLGVGLKELAASLERLDSGPLIAAGDLWIELTLGCVAARGVKRRLSKDSLHAKELLAFRLHLIAQLDLVGFDGLCQPAHVFVVGEVGPGG